ncbi:hypothetical protein BDV06DRAFT_227035 [Aspergillus oleicola]
MVTVKAAVGEAKPLPDCRSTWRERVEECGTGSAASVHSPGVELDSASAIKLEQDFEWTRAGRADWEHKARELLSIYDSWRKYLRSLRPDLPIEESIFAQEHQRQCVAIETDNMTLNAVVSSPHKFRERKPHQLNMNVASMADKLGKMNLEDQKTPGATENPKDEPPQDTSTQDSPGSEWGADDPELVSLLYPATEDEEIVNTALLDYLISLILYAGLPLRLSLHRLPLHAEFETAKYEARTDGRLKCKKGVPRDKKVRALIEVKPVMRSKKRNAICMQEAAQIVAWLMTFPDTGGCLNERGRRIHVSQDRHQIFFLIPEYNNDYLAYLNNPSKDSDAFLTIREYGPFDTREPSHMKQLAPIFVAIVLRAQADLKAEKAL